MLPCARLCAGFSSPPTCPFVPLRSTGGKLTDNTDGGAFLYLFSRFLFAAGFGCVSVAVVLADVSSGDSLPSSASLLSGLEKAVAPLKSPEKVMSYCRNNVSKEYSR